MILTLLLQGRRFVLLIGGFAISPAYPSGFAAPSELTAVPLVLDYVPALFPALSPALFLGFFPCLYPHLYQRLLRYPRALSVLSPLNLPVLKGCSVHSAIYLGDKPRLLCDFLPARSAHSRKAVPQKARLSFPVTEFIFKHLHISLPPVPARPAYQYPALVYPRRSELIPVLLLSEIEYPPITNSCLLSHLSLIQSLFLVPL